MNSFEYDGPMTCDKLEADRAYREQRVNLMLKNRDSRTMIDWQKENGKTRVRIDMGNGAAMVAAAAAGVAVGIYLYKKLTE